MGIGRFKASSFVGTHDAVKGRKVPLIGIRQCMEILLCRLDLAVSSQDT
jgi:hypothetical protein